MCICIMHLSECTVFENKTSLIMTVDLIAHHTLTCNGQTENRPIIQSVSRLVNITTGGDFLGLLIKEVHINMGPILDGYGVMGIF